ncbi:MAG: hypothetical protein R2695_18680 [Acidimicrobiales bacterium]
MPPEEIESITKHLIDHHDLDVIVKLNPTLLGYETVAGIVNDELGYRDVPVQESAFAADLQFERGVELIGELDEYAKARGHRFGIKLTNTLVVDNHRGSCPTRRCTCRAHRCTCSPVVCSTASRRRCPAPS